MPGFWRHGWWTGKDNTLVSGQPSSICVHLSTLLPSCRLVSPSMTWHISGLSKVAHTPSLGRCMTLAPQSSRLEFESWLHLQAVFCWASHLTICMMEIIIPTSGSSPLLSLLFGTVFPSYPQRSLFYLLQGFTQLTFL